VTDMQPSCLLYAVVEAGPGAAERLGAALAAVQIASVLITPPDDAVLDAASTKPLVEIIQRAGAAALIADNADLAKALRADGVHLGISMNPADTYVEARRILGPRAIVGVDAGISRDDAMTLAEAGAEYVAFGAPLDLSDLDKARGRRADMIAWWAEIFEVPCVAFDVESGQAAEALARAGADFVAVMLPTAESPAAARDLVVEIATAISMVEAMP
jgi:thiamine-phosphate pyrophosphorylase